MRTRRRSRPSWARWLEPWFAAYALTGLLVNGMVPVMIPLTTEQRGPVAVGIVVAAFFAGQLTAPLAGGMADRTGRQRVIFLGSYPVMAVAVVLFGLSDGLVPWILTAAVAGAAAGAAQTLGSVFIVEGHPRAEWDDRIGWFRLTFGLGQVAGLMICAVFAERSLTTGWIVAGAVVASGVLLGRIGLPHLPAVGPGPSARPARGAGAARPGLGSLLASRFGIFLLTWLATMIGVQTFLNVMPLIMRETFAMGASTAATLYLTGSIAGALLYPVCGEIAARRGSAFVLAVGMVTTLAAFGVMTVTWLMEPGGNVVLGAAALIVVALAYPFNYIGATTLAAELTRGSEGAAMGLFNSAVAAGAIVGGGLASVIGHLLSYPALLPISASLLVAALVIGTPVLFRRAPTSGVTGPKHGG